MQFNLIPLNKKHLYPHSVICCKSIVAKIERKIFSVLAVEEQPCNARSSRLLKKVGGVGSFVSM